VADFGRVKLEGLPTWLLWALAALAAWSGMSFLAPGVQAQVVGATALTLGPEATIAPQRVVLSLGQQRIVLATDGLGPFTVAEEAPRS